MSIQYIIDIDIETTPGTISVKATPVSAYYIDEVYEYENTKWYTVRMPWDSEIGSWIKSNSEELWWESYTEWKHAGSFVSYAVHEKLYSYICLKWTK